MRLYIIGVSKITTIKSLTNQRGTRIGPVIGVAKPIQFCMLSPQTLLFQNMCNPPLSMRYCQIPDTGFPLMITPATFLISVFRI